MAQHSGSMYHRWYVFTHVLSNDEEPRWLTIEAPRIPKRYMKTHGATVRGHDGSPFLLHQCEVRYQKVYVRAKMMSHHGSIPRLSNLFISPVVNFAVPVFPIEWSESYRAMMAHYPDSVYNKWYIHTHVWRQYAEP